MLVRDLLIAADRSDLVEAASLLVSEVVTNALLHAGTPIDVVAALGETGLRVEVADGSSHLPIRRRYALTAGTGRGMLMLEQMVDDWGVSRHPRGKTVWFHLSRPQGSAQRSELREDDNRRRRTPEDTITVELCRVPLLLHAAWQEHAEALLREYLLSRLDEDGDLDPIQVHAEATDAIAILEEQIPRADVAMEPDRLMQDATEPFVTVDRIELSVPVASVPHFATLDRAIEESVALSLAGKILTPPTQPEVQMFRHWLCRQVLDQAAGSPPVPWSVEGEPPVEQQFELNWDPRVVSEAATGIIAADEANRILAISPSALEILGYDAADQLVGRRLVAIVPERFRQAHVAGFTMYLFVGRQPMLGLPVEVPALRRDGSEVPVELVITADQVGEGRTLFLADIRRSGG